QPQPADTDIQASEKQGADVTVQTPEATNLNRGAGPQPEPGTASTTVGQLTETLRVANAPPFSRSASNGFPGHGPLAISELLGTGVIYLDLDGATSVTFNGP